MKDINCVDQTLDTVLNINMQNLSEEERNQVLALIQKINTPEQKDVPVIERAETGEKYYVLVSSDRGFFESLRTTELNYASDNKLYSNYNYFTDRSLADKVADYINANLLFIRKAIEFADGYEWKHNAGNYFVDYRSSCDEYSIDYSCSYKQKTTVYMSEGNAKRFAEWCNLNKQMLMC